MGHGLPTQSDDIGVEAAHDAKKLRWRCRRGMRELDVLLTAYLDGPYASASEDLRAAFSDLLEQEDDQLWDWLLGRSAPSDARLQRIVAKISDGK